MVSEGFLCYSDQQRSATPNMTSKQDKLLKISRLSAKRREDNYKNYRSLSGIFDGLYDKHEFVSPWTISACNVDSPLMLIAQDWASEDGLLSEQDESKRNAIQRLGYCPSLQTNRNLQRLLHDHFGLAFEDVYATNAFVFIKQGGMSARIPNADLLYSVKKYTLEEIKIVLPKMVICIGANTHKTLFRSIGARVTSIEESLESPTEFRGAAIYGSYHTGAWGTKAAGGDKGMSDLWKRLGEKFDQHR